jgi:hypothetical protein
MLELNVAADIFVQWSSIIRPIVGKSELHSESKLILLLFPR